MQAEKITGAKRRLLERLKRGGPATPGELADSLGLTEAAVRQHLQALSEGGLVESSPRPASGRGRPSAEWSLTALAQDIFPDRHADLTLELIASARAAFGQQGLDRLIAHRAREQQAAYAAMLDKAGAGLGARVRALARRRTDEGYMAEVVREGKGRYLLIERHCPICEAAKACAGLCKAELDVFTAALGEDVDVCRTEHLLAEGGRCVYRVVKKPTR